MRDRSRGRLVGALLFALQFLLAAALVLSANFTSRSVLGWVVASLGAALAIWSWFAIGLRRLSVLPEVRAGATLVTRPPYRTIRHPMYSGLLLFCAGLLSMSYAHWKLAVWALLLLTLDTKARLEERLLAERFAGYAEYRRRTHRFIPFIY